MSDISGLSLSYRSLISDVAGSGQGKIIDGYRPARFEQDHECQNNIATTFMTDLFR
jgi:hypothetical protein